ncbi:uncharacterized protein CIMG_13038 [Coccidioides immitis RS]|uniref:Uncharacterized protein n=1 Tax=Coccidioides immitis (strain RS) TaxID=246410 RepID=J3K7T9_COCIM|nr:uncharacterized protein CIMG_13038 [Coccidioides immitis RS]EAS30803.3 hypothetical protein CIMG_13038 [Coccidioides immitis RS]TPX23700.1 hypothetical protein DIZ76_013038 [Coccidioides immitis]
MKTLMTLLALGAMLLSTLAEANSLTSKFTESCSVSNGIRRCCPGSMNMQVTNGKLSGHCCVPVGGSKRDNNDRGEGNIGSNVHITVKDDGGRPCPRGQVAVPVTAEDYDQRIVDLRGQRWKQFEQGGAHNSMGACKARPVAFSGVMGLLVAAGM